MFNKVTLCLMAILGSASALASHGDDIALSTASGVELMAPHQQGSWSFGVQANYFKANNDFNYAFAGDQTFDTPDIYDADTYSVDQDGEWGWGADVTYHFPGNGRDVTLAFSQLDSSESDSVALGTGSGSYLYASGIQSDLHDGQYGEISTENASGHVDTDYTAVDLTFGQKITVGNRVTLHPFAGVRYADIDYKADASYFDTDSSDITTSADEFELKSEFTGIGPRLGSDAAVNLGGGFSLRGTLGVSLLVGHHDDSYNFAHVSFSGGIPTASGSSYYDQDMDNDETRVVPEADAKLAAAYNMDLNNGYGFGIEVGYQVTNYFNAVMNDSSSYYDTSNQYTDFSMSGPYARVQLDVA